MGETVKEKLQEHLEQESRWLSNIVRMQLVVKDLGLNDLDAYVNIQSYSFSDDDLPRIDISPMHKPGIGIFVDEPKIDMAVTDTTPLLSQIARKILPVVGRLDKSFDENYNKVTLTTVYQGIKIRISDSTPKTCSVERVEEEVEVPEKVIPAHTEKRVRYRLVGDCDPILADEAAHVVTSQGAVEVGDGA